MPLSADVLFAESLSSEEAIRLIQDFADIGLNTDLREVSPRRSLSDAAWLALIVVPLKPLYEQLAKDFATDAYGRLRTLVGKIFQAGNSTTPPRILLMQDSTTGVQVVIEPDLPEQAYRKLLSFDFSTVHRGPLHYDVHRHQWRSELDEVGTSS